VIIIESQAAGPFMKNGFVVACSNAREGVLIDPGDEVQGLLDYARQERITLTHILLTHAHVDHVTGVPSAKAALKVPLHLHKDDLFLYERAEQQAWVFGVKIDGTLPPIDVYYSPSDVIRFGEFQITPHHTPGHCPGGVCLAARKRGDSTSPPDLFVGDTLFADSIGRTDLPGGDYDTLIGSIRSVLFPFGDEARVHPGHGPSTTIGHERRNNPFLAAHV
jgi:glyoxylase-like metal-dependent hydrolase (beta-lactamase superfamily II)